MGKGRRSRKRQVRFFYILSTYGKIKKKEKMNSRKLSIFLVGMWYISKGLQSQPNSKEAKVLSVIFCTLKIVWWKNLKTTGFFILD